MASRPRRLSPRKNTPCLVTNRAFDTFETEAARQAHLDGEIPQALGQVAPDLLAGAPDIRMVEVIAAT